MLRIYLLVNERKTDGASGRANKSDAILEIGEHQNRQVPPSGRLLHVLWLIATLFLKAVFHLLYHLLTKCIKIHTYVSQTAVCFGSDIVFPFILYPSCRVWNPCYCNQHVTTYNFNPTLKIHHSLQPSFSHQCLVYDAIPPVVQWMSVHSFISIQP